MPNAILIEAWDIHVVYMRHTMSYLKKEKLFWRFNLKKQKKNFPGNSSHLASGSNGVLLPNSIRIDGVIMFKSGQPKLSDFLGIIYNSLYINPFIPFQRKFHNASLNDFSSCKNCPSHAWCTICWEFYMCSSTEHYLCRTDSYFFIQKIIFQYFNSKFLT